jgi:L-ascorbate metabolism protein UlaG (beta-lactamase superfamily)
MKTLTALLTALLLTAGVPQSGPAHVDMTWLSIANMYFEIGGLRILADGYITRLPQSAFYGGGGGLASTRQAFVPDEAGVRKVLLALGGPTSVTHLLTGHSHFDHSFDTATWSSLTGAAITGSRTTCFQAIAEGVPANRCTEVKGGERIMLAPGVTMRVVRWNHSGSSAANPEQHDPIELSAPPKKDPATGGLRAGVAEDFPNGGGNRAYLFVVDGPNGRYSWFFQDSASASSLTQPMMVDGEKYDAPLENLRAALGAERLESVDLWIGTGGAAIARLVLPVLRPKAYLPVHWDGLWGKFEAGVPRPYADPGLDTLLTASNVRLVRPGQYADKWRLDYTGVQPRPNDEVKAALGFR